MEELQEECMQLTPSFEIKLFENDEDAADDFFDSDDNNDDEYDPFISGNAVDSNAGGFQSLVNVLIVLVSQIYFIIPKSYKIFN